MTGSVTIDQNLIHQRLETDQRAEFPLAENGLLERLTEALLECALERGRERRRGWAVGLESQWVR